MTQPFLIKTSRISATVRTLSTISISWKDLGTALACCYGIAFALICCIKMINSLDPDIKLNMEEVSRKMIEDECFNRN